MTLEGVQTVISALSLIVTASAVLYARREYRRARKEKTEGWIQGIIEEFQQRIIEVHATPPGHNPLLNQEESRVRTLIYAMCDPVLRKVLLRERP